MNCLMAYNKSSANTCDKHLSFQNKSCCHNEYVSVETDSAFNGAEVKLNLQDHALLVLYLFTHTNPYVCELDSEISKPYNTPPPIVKQDYQSAHQVYIV